jgi:hypothetical protein
VGGAGGHGASPVDFDAGKLKTTPKVCISTNPGDIGKLH